MFAALTRIFTGHTDETEFLPAAIEIVETPPKPAGRIIAASIMLFFLIAILWACIGSVDIIATASGKIIPTGRTKVIQPLESGVVHTIHVQDGQKVKAGDVLIEIDTTISAAERDRLKNDYTQATLDTARLKAALELDGDPVKSFIPPEGATDTQITLQKSLLANQVDEIRAKMSDLDHQIAQNTGNRDAVASTFTRYGLIRGKVESVSQDAIVREKPQDKSGANPHAGDESDSSEPDGQELVYSARVSLEKNQMQIDDRLVNLGPGMAVTVEIKTGSRRIIEYLLSPLLRHKQQAMREM